jgi:hypothetical protein
MFKSRLSALTFPLGVPAEITLLMGLTLTIHALVLLFVFPGYYNPLWPNHSDFYIPVALAESGLRYTDYIRFPRPIGTIFLDAIGNLGVRGAMLVVITIVLLNTVLTAAFFRRVLRIKLDWPFLFAFSAYAFLVFSHPYFYVFSTYDGFSQLSYLMLLSAAWFFFKYDAIQRPEYIIISATLLIFSFLIKETYSLSAMLFGAIWFFINRQNSIFRAAIPIAAVGVAVAIAFLINAINSAPFVAAADYVDSPYLIELSPSKLVSEWGRYAADGLNLLTFSLLLLVAATTFIFFRRHWLVMLLPLSGAFAWLPNAALPNHYSSGYSFNGIYLIYLPVLLVALLWRVGPIARVLSSLLIIGALCSPIFLNATYKNNDWILKQEDRQRNLLQAIKGLTAELKFDVSSKRILVTGLNFPYTPFDHGPSMRSFAPSEDMQFDVITYKPRRGGVAAFPLLEAQPSDVKFISPQDVNFSHYQRVWAFNSDGTLAMNISEPSLFLKSEAKDGFSAAELLLYPNLLRIFSGSNLQYMGERSLTGYQYLDCGVQLLSYENLSGAKACLIQSVRLIPENPYPYFYLGQLYEREEFFSLAVSFYEKAVFLDNPKSPNSYFRRELDRVQKSMLILK